MQELEQTIKHAQVVTVKVGGSEVVQIGSKVVVQMGKQSINFELVGANEGDPATGKLSVESPVGAALMGRKAKEQVSVATPGGTMQYTISSIS